MKNSKWSQLNSKCWEKIITSNLNVHDYFQTRNIHTQCNSNLINCELFEHEHYVIFYRTRDPRLVPRPSWIWWKKTNPRKGHHHHQVGLLVCCQPVTECSKFLSVSHKKYTLKLESVHTPSVVILVLKGCEHFRA